MEKIAKSYYIRKLNTGYEFIFQQIIKIIEFKYLEKWKSK